jgi:FxsC-like protein
MIGKVRARRRRLGGIVLYFFLSYARGDEDALVARFFEDLCVEVRLQAGLSRNAPVGFVDQTLQVGQHWPRRLTDALARCGSFLALMTPRYFSSAPCGREWKVFADRANSYDARHSVDSSLLKPLMWIPMAQARIHAVARPIQYQSPGLGDLYQRLGIRQLMRLKRHEDDYHSLLFELARQIVENVDAHRIPHGRLDVDYSNLPSAFDEPADEATQADSRSGSESLKVHFVVAASDRDEMSAIREQLAYYGGRPADWAPYRDEHSDPVVASACHIATERSIAYRLTNLTDLNRCADVAGQQNQIVVLLLDAWVTQLEHAKQALTDYNARTAQGNSPTTAVLIPASKSDNETRQRWPDLSQACREVLDRLVHDDELYRSAIPTFSLFELGLPEVLEVARNRVYSTGQVKRPLSDRASTEPPRVDGPWMSHPHTEGS